MNIPAAYAATLAHVQGHFPGAMIAGGCLRDLDNDRPVKDVDIFLPNLVPPPPPPLDPSDFFACLATDDFEWLRWRVSASLPMDGQIVGVMGSYEGWATEEVLGVFDISTPLLDYQLICLTTGPETILPRMDFGICRISYDGDMVHRTNEYHADKHNERFTLLRCGSHTELERSLARHKRLSEKYVGWPIDLTLIAPDQGGSEFVFN